MTFVVSIALAAPGAFTVTGPITTTVEAPFQQLTLPIEAYLAADSPDLRDLRVLDATGAEVPYARVPPTASETTLSVAIHPFHGELFPADVQLDPQGLLLGVTQPHASGTPLHGYVFAGDTVADVVALDVSLANPDAGYQAVAVEASEDGVQWVPVGGGATILRTTVGGHDLRRGRIDLPPGKHRLLRVVWPADTAAVGVDAIRVTVRLGAGDEPPLVWTPSVAASRTPEGDVLVLPVAVRAEALRVEASDANVLAPVTLSTWVEPGAGWRDVATGLIYRLHAQDRDWTNDPFPLAGPVRALRLHANQGSLGDPPPSLALGLHPDRVIFAATGTAPYRLAVGRPDSPAVALAPHTLVPLLGTSEGPPIGAATASLTVPLLPSAVLREAPAPAVPRAWKLWGILGAGVVVLGAMAVSLFRRTRD